MFFFGFLMNMSGLSVEPKQYCGVIISNMPYPGDRGPPANPTKSLLEMVLIENDVKKKTKSPNQIKKKLIPILFL